MKLVYTNDNSPLVNLAKGMLENAEIPVTLKNEFASSGMGGGYNIFLELWVLDDNDFDRAKVLIDSLSESNEA